MRSAQGHQDPISRVLSRIQVRQGRVRTAPVGCAGRWTCTLYFDVSSAASSHLAFTYQRILHSPSCSIAQTHLKWARELCRSSSVAKSAIILDSLQSRRSPSVHLHDSENRTSRYPCLLSVHPGRQISAGKATLLYLTVWQCVLLSEKDHQPCVFSDCSGSICYDTIRGGNDRVDADFVTSMVWHGPFTCVLESKCQAGLMCVCAKEPFPSAHSECQAFKPTLPCDSCSRVEHLSREPISSRLTLFTYLRVTCRRFPPDAHTRAAATILLNETSATSRVWHGREDRPNGSASLLGVCWISHR